MQVNRHACAAPVQDNQQLELVSGSAFLGLDQLTSLRLSSNRNLARLEPGALEPLVSLRQLDLEQNRLTHLDLRPNHLEGLEVKLAGNSWNCNCSLLPLQTFLAAQGNNTSDIICDQPPELRGRDLVTVDLTASCPSQLSNYTLMVALCASILSLLGAAAIIVAIVFHRRLRAAYNRQQWMKQHQPAGGRLSKGQDYQIPPDLFQAVPIGRDIPVTEL